MLTKKKSQDLANKINNIKLQIKGFDINYAKEVINEMNNHVKEEVQNSHLKLHYNPTNTELLVKQVEAIEYLVKFVESLLECDILIRRVRLIEKMYNKSLLINKAPNSNNV
jgi:hypothetical protein